VFSDADESLIVNLELRIVEGRVAFAGGTRRRRTRE
jgi:hypothetical protein